MGLEADALQTLLHQRVLLPVEVVTAPGYGIGDWVCESECFQASAELYRSIARPLS